MPAPITYFFSIKPIVKNSFDTVKKIPKLNALIQYYSHFPILLVR